MDIDVYSFNVRSEWLMQPYEANRVIARAGFSLNHFASDDGWTTNRAGQSVSSGYSLTSYRQIRNCLHHEMESIAGRAYTLRYVNQVMRYPEFQEVVICKWGNWRSQVESVSAFVRDVWYPNRQRGIAIRTGRAAPILADLSPGDLF